MGTLSQAKTLGGVGAIFTLLLFVPYGIGALLVIVGWILILVALKNVSEALKDAKIYRNAMISVILSIVGVAIFAFVVAAAVLGFVGLGFAVPMSTPPAVTSDVVGLIAGVVGGLAVVWILAIVASYFLWQSYKEISKKLNMGLFGTAALLFFIGAICTIFLVGFLLMFVAQIMFVIAFFSLPENPPGAGPMSSAPPPSPPTMSS